MEWAREGEGREGDLKYLLAFLKGEIDRRQRARCFQLSTAEKEGSEKRKPPVKPRSAAALQTSSASGCGFCHKTHATAKCWGVQNLTRKEKEAKIREASLCFKCLKPGHFARSCAAKCVKCQGGHHRLCCPETETKDEETKIGQCEAVKSSLASCPNNSLVGSAPAHSRVMLQTMQVKVHGSKGLTKATMLLDSGSDRTYVTQRLVRRLGLKWLGATEIRYAVFGGGQSNSHQRDTYELKAQGRGKPLVTLKAVEVPVICAPLARPKVDVDTLRAFEGIGLAEQHSDSDEVNIDILVGLDCYWEVVKGTTRRLLGSNLVALETVFGWVLSGKLEEPAESTVSPQWLCLNDIPEVVVRRFWELDSLGICSRGSADTSNKVLDEFNSSVQFKDGRYVVGLPWKEESVRPVLLDNEVQARFRLQRLSQKLNKDFDLKAGYNGVLTEMEKTGIIEEVPCSDTSTFPIFYLPHRPVIKESSTSTKIRPVFDASAKGPNSVSLNDCLEAGPPLIPCLVEVLLRFRRWKIALTADLTKAFLQVGLQRKDQDVHRFLWEQGGIVRKMRFLRVTFGNKASPFLLNATIKHHLTKYPTSVAVQELAQNLYVDDWLTGANTEEEVHKMFREAMDIMDQAGMCLSKWNSSSLIIHEKFHGGNGHVLDDSGGVKVLGVRWMPEGDYFTFDGVSLPADIQTTKRVVLSFIARTFDPLGFAVPFIMTAKILFQKLWLEGVGWDETVPEEIHNSFLRWLDGLQCLQNWRIPRMYAPVTWDGTRVELHSFGDASECGYGAVIYMRIRKMDGSITTSLISSRARVAPLKRVTLPRLELLASLLAARLLNFVRQALRLPDDMGYYCWTDSKAALGWIKGNPHRWKQFVANRVSEIQDLTEPSHWFHCPGSDNPADLTTRGMDARALVDSSLWKHGPA
jgi:hypothetical protein